MNTSCHKPADNIKNIVIVCINFPQTTLALLKTQHDQLKTEINSCADC